MRVVFMGTPSYAVPVLEILQLSADLDVVAVVTPPDRPRGRGQSMEATPVKVAAQKADIPVFQPASLRPSHVQEELASLNADVSVVAAYGKLLPANVLDLPRHGCLNIHPSLLPRYRGPSPVVTALLEGLETTGVTLMLLDEGMDTGPILVQEEYRLRGDETAGSLTEELFRVGGRLLVENLGPWAGGQLEATKQDESQATLTRKVERTDGRADWNLAAAELERRQRAFTPWPGLFTQWQGKIVRLLDVKAMDPPGDGLEYEPGQIGLVQGLGLTEVPLGVGTANGILGIKTLQLEGRRAATAEEFMRGYPHFPGSYL
ncbi:MAG: methionyl-tRNA formyltransferase [Chloroflexi bacterium]|nr:methionyl-tRNA formyltransferase [Chloroflexota bacterium]